MYSDNYSCTVAYQVYNIISYDCMVTMATQNENLLTKVDQKMTPFDFVVLVLTDFVAQ